MLCKGYASIITSLFGIIMSLLHRVLLQPIITYFSLQNLQMIIWIISWLFVVFIDHYSFNSLLFICFLFIIIIIIIISTLPASVSRFSLQISNSQQGFSSISLLKVAWNHHFPCFLPQKKSSVSILWISIFKHTREWQAGCYQKSWIWHAWQTNATAEFSTERLHKAYVHSPPSISWRKHHWIFCSAMHS